MYPHSLNAYGTKQNVSVHEFVVGFVVDESVRRELVSDQCQTAVLKYVVSSFHRGVTTGRFLLQTSGDIA